MSQRRSPVQIAALQAAHRHNQIVLRSGKGPRLPACVQTVREPHLHPVLLDDDDRLAMGMGLVDACFRLNPVHAR